MDGKNEPAVYEHIMTALNWSYDKAVNGIPNLDRAEELAESYLAKSKSPDDAIDSLIAWQIGKAGVAGFVTNLGGALTLPIAIPANVVGVFWIQIRMIAAIAHIRGYDIRSDQVKALVLASLAGTSVTDVLKDAGVQFGTNLSMKAISQISGATITKINQAVGFRLLTRAGSTGAINLVKIVPFVGGLISGGVDGVVTRAIGTAAKKVFVAHPKGEDAVVAQAS